MKNRILAFTAPAVAVLLSILPAQSTTLTLQQGVSGYSGYTDTTIRSDNPTTTYNNTTNGLFAGVTLAPGTIRGIMNFDLSLIPVGATINSISLTLVTLKSDGASNPYAYQLDLVSLGTAFTEATATWNTTNGTTAWPTPGGDIGSTILSSTNIDPQFVLPSSTHTFATSSSFVALAQSAADGSNNLELALKLSSEVQDTFRKVYFFYDSAGGTLAPQLTIDYTAIPEPSAAALLLLAVGTLLATTKTRRRASA